MGNVLGTVGPTQRPDLGPSAAERQDCEPIGEDDINRLPNELLIDIFGLLSAEEQGRLCLVCRRWNDILSNWTLWQYKLFKTYGIWNVSDALCQPPMVRQAGKVVPVRQVIFDPNASTNVRVMYNIRERSSVVKTCPLNFRCENAERPIKLLLFGLGIESRSTSKIAKLILCGRCSTFHATGLVQGTSPGFGGGIAIKYKSKHDVHIYTLYTNVRSVREKEIDVMMLDNLFSKWMVGETAAPGNEEESQGGRRELQDGLKSLVASVDGFVYVTDSTSESRAIDEDVYVSKARDCLHLIMEEADRSEHVQGGRPILVLSCIKKAEMPKYTCYAEVDKLKLDKLNNRPWNVCEVDLNSVGELEHGMDWLLYYHFNHNDHKEEQGCDQKIEKSSSNLQINEAEELKAIDEEIQRTEEEN